MLPLISTPHLVDTTEILWVAFLNKMSALSTHALGPGELSKVRMLIFNLRREQAWSKPQTTGLGFHSSLGLPSLAKGIQRLKRFNINDSHIPAL